MNIPTLADFRRIVVKVGSSLLVDRRAGGLRETWLASLSADLAELHRDRRDLLVVSSGAIALGRAVLKLPSGPLKLEDSQAAAAVGQIALARTWSEALSRHGIVAGQVLVTLGDTEERRRYLNARSTIDTLLQWRALPVINENDTVATNEIRYGDNDRLAARVATMVSADLLVLLSDIDGLYDAPPDSNAGARHIPCVSRITSEIESMAGSAGSELSRGGMQTKIEAGGSPPMPAPTWSSPRASSSIRCGLSPKVPAAPGFSPPPIRLRREKNGLQVRSSRRERSSSMPARSPPCARGKSLLPAGVVGIEGSFARGDAVIIRGPGGTEIGRGLVAYDIDDALKIRGRSSTDIRSILGFSGRAEMVHRDDLAVSPE